jgi:hypothetical protein
MGVMANGAALAHGFVLEHKGTGLFAMTLGAGFVEPCHGEATLWFENFHAVRVVALHASQVAFNHLMMLREVEFALHVEVTLKTCAGSFSGVDDELAVATAGGDVFAAGSVAGFAAGVARAAQTFHGSGVEVDAGVWAGGEDPGVITVAFGAGFVANVGCAGDIGRSHNGSIEGGAGIEQGYGPG